jgi:hypothetical protein
MVDLIVDVVVRGPILVLTPLPIVLSCPLSPGRAELGLELSKMRYRLNDCVATVDVNTESSRVSRGNARQCAAVQAGYVATGSVARTLLCHQCHPTLQAQHVKRPTSPD